MDTWKYTSVQTFVRPMFSMRCDDSFCHWSRRVFERGHVNERPPIVDGDPDFDDAPESSGTAGGGAGAMRGGGGGGGGGGTIGTNPYNTGAEHVVLTEHEAVTDDKQVDDGDGDAADDFVQLTDDVDVVVDGGTDEAGIIFGLLRWQETSIFFSSFVFVSGNDRQYHSD